MAYPFLALTPFPLSRLRERGILAIVVVRALCARTTTIDLFTLPYRGGGEGVGCLQRPRVTQDNQAIKFQTKRRCRYSYGVSSAAAASSIVLATSSGDEVPANRPWVESFTAWPTAGGRYWS